jgi:SAM-dependent methyltransferase
VNDHPADSPFMLKYLATAVALKAFSTTRLTRSWYRSIGNRKGNQRRAEGPMPGYYADRLKWVLRLQKQYEIVRDGDRILELGTGWLHWEALTLRLFYDIEAVLFDVWDNRQFGALKNYFRQLSPMLNEGFDLTGEEIRRARSVIERIVAAESFDALYQSLGFSYIVESSGSLARLPANTFRLVISGGVLEHVNRSALSDLISETQAVLRGGGWAVHSIDVADHLEHYDRSVSPKFYLSLPEGVWKTLCENKVQYINRVQRKEWLDLFQSSGFTLVDEEARRVNIGKLPIAKRFADMEKTDLECTVLRLALGKNP